MSLLSRLAVQAARAYGILSSKSTNVSADYLVVAGGGGSGGGGSGVGAFGGGGGAGGYRTSTFTLSTLNTYSIAVGAGGNGGALTVEGTKGNNSAVSGTGLTTVTSTGGGYGGGAATSAAGDAGGPGGSGGGGGGNSSGGAGGAGGTGNQGSYSPVEGYNGAGSVTGGFGGGGGGSSAAATNQNGAAGTANSISGSSVTYAAGGAGTSGASIAGTANTGNGAKGGGENFTGAAGGSGVVIISYTSATPKFVGGTITTSGGKQIHTFTSSGTLSPITPITASYLVVAGGGGGGSSGGGGGAGGLLTNSTTLYSGATYVVTVGAGGNGGAANATTGTASSGSSSSLSGTGLTTLTATGGGGGGNYSVSGATGGSGGGAGRDSGSGGAGTSGQGFAGGATGVTGASGGAGGGGGSSAVGSAGVTNGTGNGGAGTSSSISGTSTTYAGGGGGGGYNSGTNGTGGSGGGGTGGTNAAQSGVSGTPNTGGGGGGAGGAGGGSVAGASGGSGIVIISYAGSQVFNGGLVTTSGGNTIHTFTSTGALTPLTNNLNNSLRFRSSASAYLNRTPTLAGSTTIGTFSNWLKLGAISTDRMMYHVIGTSGNNNRFYISFNADNTFQIVGYNSSASIVLNLNTTQVLRDPSAWYHIVVAIDTTQATSSNRAKLYINGNQVTAFSTATYPSQNQALGFTNNTSTLIGANQGPSNYYDGYMTDINFIDGQALEPYYFGNNDANGVWKPIQYKGTYGTNGFYLTFGNTTSTTTLGYDSSPNGNNWTTNNISITSGSTYDPMLDVPTNTSATVANYATLNPNLRQTGTGQAPTSGNLKLTANTTGYSQVCCATIASTSGKFYWEVTVNGGYGGFGIADSNNSAFTSVVCTTSSVTANPGQYTWGWTIEISNGNKQNNNVSTSYGSAASSGDVYMCAVDIDNGKIWWGKNGTWFASGSPAAGTNAAFTNVSGNIIPYFSPTDAGGWTQDVNFGQRPFSYTPPTGFVALNTYNLPTPTILAGNKYMDATLYTGNGGTQSITNAAGFRPDFVWIKDRTTAYPNMLFDSVRGASKRLISNTTDSEATETDTQTSFNSNGFSVSTNLVVNRTPDAFVGWQWQAGQGSTSSNTSGSITSTVSVNTTAGFSIVTYAGTLTSAGVATVGHGLGVAPKMIISKSRGTSQWVVQHTSLTSPSYFLYLNTTDAQDNKAGNGTMSAPTSTVFSTNWTTGLNVSGSNLVAYCFAEIAGFSRFGSYTANGSADGPFIYTGFRPRWIMFKRTTSATNWYVVDTAIEAYNAGTTGLYPNTSAAESTEGALDILSNGFKPRVSSGAFNYPSGETFIYAAFAEHPFKNSNAR